MAEQKQEEQWRRADGEVRKKLPPGVKLVRTLRGHTNTIGRIAWSPDGRLLASPSYDRTVQIWDATNGKSVQRLVGHADSVRAVAWKPDGTSLVSVGGNGELHLWDTRSWREMLSSKLSIPLGRVAWSPFDNLIVVGACTPLSKGYPVQLLDGVTGQQIRGFLGPSGWISEVIWSQQRNKFVTGSYDGRIILWDSKSGAPNMQIIGQAGEGVTALAWLCDGKTLISGSNYKTLSIWDIESLKQVAIVEAHTEMIYGVDVAHFGSLIVSKSRDNTVKLWRADGRNLLGIIPETAYGGEYGANAVFNPVKPILATTGEKDTVIHIWELDLAVLLGQEAEPSAHYVNAKVVLVGDTGVGKTGLSLVLNNQPYKETDSTAGRHVWTFGSREVEVGSNVTQTRETLLWDLAGQPGYRVIHQLHLNEVAVALVVFDARSETDPLAGVRHWERALRLAQQRQGTSGVPMKKFLVSARNDRGGVSISEERLEGILKEFGFDGYFKTSAKEGWQVKELRAAIEQAVAWENLPEVSSSQLFADIKSFLLEVKKTGRLLAPVNELYDEFARQHADTAAKVANLRDQFDTCIGRLENRDLIRRLTFGGYVLLQPELLDAYASAMVNTAKEEPDGLGSLAEEIALTGKFFVPEEQKVKDPGQEQLLLHATVEELVRHDLSLRENADDGRYLVFPSQFTRDYEDAPEPKGKAVAITFDGPVQSLYSTLAVRLGHSGLFTTRRVEMWRNAAVFTAKAGGKCGIYLHEFAEGRGRLILFFPDDSASMETRFHFEEFVLAHARHRSLDGTVEFVRFFVCPDCGDPVPDSYVKRLREKGTMEFVCPCGGTVSLAEPQERIHFTSKVEAMGKSADRQRDFEAFVMSAKGETSTRCFQDWAGDERVTLAIVFTDVVGSTALQEEIKEEAMNEVRRAHFAQSRKLIGQFQGREIKTIGDSFMAAFRSADKALDYAIALQSNTGHPKVQIRAGIHIGPMQVEEGDVFGGTVNFAARVVGTIKGAEIWLSDRAKEDINRLGAEKHARLKWERHDSVAMKGFPGVFTLWSLKK